MPWAKKSSPPVIIKWCRPPPPRLVGRWIVWGTGTLPVRMVREAVKRAYWKSYCCRQEVVRLEEKQCKMWKIDSVQFSTWPRRSIEATAQHSPNILKKHKFMKVDSSFTSLDHDSERLPLFSPSQHGDLGSNKLSVLLLSVVCQAEGSRTQDTTIMTSIFNSYADLYKVIFPVAYSELYWFAGSRNTLNHVLYNAQRY